MACEYKKTCKNAQDSFVCNDSIECMFCGIYKQNVRDEREAL